MTSTQGKQVFVTGGGRGIGGALVRRLADCGYDVTFTYHASKALAEALAAELSSECPGQRFEARHLDLGDRAQVEATASDLAASAQLYAFVHNAGATYDALCAVMNQDRAAELMQVNFWSMTCLAASAMRPMIRARKGRIVSTGSITAMLGTAGNAAYAASKGAMQSYMKTLAVELAGKGVTVNVVAPGYVDTDMMAPYAGLRFGVEKQIPAGRYAQADEIAALIEYLLGADAGYVTGAVIPIDGGLSAAVGVGR